MRPINRFLLENGLRLASNPCISPDFCLAWPSLARSIASGNHRALTVHPKSHFQTEAGNWSLVEDAEGDCAWKLETERPAGALAVLAEGIQAGAGTFYFPASWENLLAMKNLVQEHDPASTLFPTCAGTLAKGTIGVGARFTTLHWPAVEWAMSALELGLTANQNSIPRELVYDVDALLEGRLGTVPFPFIGAHVPEGHQGQSVEGMSHGCVLSKLKTGFHRRRIAWSFNADHQPIGGAFDEREDALVRGCLLASYITFDLSPELALGPPAPRESIDPGVAGRVRERIEEVGVSVGREAMDALLGTVWPALLKMKKRDEKYAAARRAAFSTEVGRAYIRELSIDELPGLTRPETTAVMLALCELLEMPVAFVAPAFGLQKNLPHPDTPALRSLIEAQWAVTRRFGVGIGFHSGSGKSADNYRAMGEVTGGRLEIKTSGRYTYEMGVALHASPDAGDRKLWQDWYRFTLELVLSGAFSSHEAEQRMARAFIEASVAAAGKAPVRFDSPGSCRAALEALEPSPGHMFFFEYNFLFVLAAKGRWEKAALGDHSRDGYLQRARFYAVSPAARLLYAKGVALYIVFLAEQTGLVAPGRCAAARTLLTRIQTYDAFLEGISR